MVNRPVTIWPSVWVLSVLLTGAAAEAASPSPTNLGWLRSQCGDGALAYQSGGNVYLTELSDGKTVKVGAGSTPEFSPDGTRLAWIDGSSAKGRLRKGDATVHVIATGVSAKGGVHWVSDQKVVVVSGGQWVKVSLSGKKTAVPELSKLGAGGTECDVKLGSDGVWSYVSGTKWKTSDGKSGSTGGSCSSSLSPDGRSVTGLVHGHKTCKLTQIRSGGVSGSLKWIYDYDGSKGFDNHRWSSNDKRFVVAQDEKYNTMVILKVGSTDVTRMGQKGGGEMYGDFTVGSGKGGTWTGGGAAACGNGKVESGETCDPPSSCPKTCDDGDPCTTDTLTGDAKSCTAACKHENIAGCCTTDSECDDSDPCTADTCEASACQHEPVDPCQADGGPEQGQVDAAPSVDGAPSVDAGTGGGRADPSTGLVGACSLLPAGARTGPASVPWGCTLLLLAILAAARRERRRR